MAPQLCIRMQGDADTNRDLNRDFGPFEASRPMVTMRNHSELELLGDDHLHAPRPVRGNAGPCIPDRAGAFDVHNDARQCHRELPQPGPPTGTSGRLANLVVALLAALALTGCLGAASAPAEPLAAPPVVLANEQPAVTPEQRAERGSCYATFDDVVAAWEELRGPLPAECRAAADGYAVRLVPVVPCKAAGGGAADGCAVLEQHTVYILEGRSPAGQVFVSTHEWLHVLADCAEGDSGHDHTDPGLWSLEDGVLGLAVANPPVGPCVEGRL